jgi:hypothetical protein
MSPRFVGFVVALVGCGLFLGRIVFSCNSDWTPLWVVWLFFLRFWVWLLWISFGCFWRIFLVYRGARLRFFNKSFLTYKKKGLTVGLFLDYQLQFLFLFFIEPA